MAFFRRRRRRGDKDSGRAPNDRDTTGFPDRIPPSSYPCHVSTRSRVSSRRLNRVDPLSLFFFSLTNLSSEFLERGSKRIICIVTIFAINRNFRGIRLEQRQKRKNSLELIAHAFSSILSLLNKKEERIRSCVSFSLPYFPNRSEFAIPFLRA